MKLNKKINLKKEKFINKVKHYLNLLKAVHERIKQLDVDKLIGKSFKQNPYQACFGWLLENISYGVLIMIIINGIFGWQGFIRNIGLISTGPLRWLTIDYIKTIRRR